jgi:CRISPR/Cas system endoribonuclease Cas6 (RAMP superfamily)
MPLPLPVNVFRTAYRAWQAFAPPRLDCPGDWLEWCARDVFVTEQQIETISVPLSKHHSQFIGFVGNVTFTAHSKSLLYLSFWHALAQLAGYSGSGAKTTMGMGASSHDAMKKTLRIRQ